MAALFLVIGTSAGITELRVVSADDVLATIKAGGPVDYDDCRIEGDLDLSGFGIEGDAHFNRTIFQGSVSFNHASFNGDAYFRDASFNDDASFWGAGFNGTAYFGSAGFNGTANFVGAGFNGDAGFVDAGFNGDAGFGSAGFNGTAYFGSAGFNGDAGFGSAEFNGDAGFGGAGFNGDAYFGSAGFNGHAYFGSAGFNGHARFVNATFNITSFSEAQFEKEAHFEDAGFTGKTSFYNARFKEDALFENATFEGELTLTRSRYSKLFIRWSSIQGGLAYDDAAYMALMKNFKDLGYYEDYDSCYYAYRKTHRGQPWPTVSGWEQFIRKAIDYPMQWFYGYGTKPFNAFFISLFIIIVFSIFWWALGLGGPKDKTKESLKEGDEWLDGDLFDLLSFSATVFLSGTRLLIDPPALPVIEERSRSMIKKAFVLERVLGALFSVMFFIAISGTIVRAS